MKYFSLHPDSMIFVACPANTVTGGPELLHQLVHELRGLNLNAFMYYYGEDNSNTPTAYKGYNNPSIPRPIDQANNIFIVPEIKTELLSKFHFLQKAIWWLSVDNYYKGFPDEWLGRKLVKKLLERIRLRPSRFQLSENHQQNIMHFVQSNYAHQHLSKYQVPESQIVFLGDYLNSYFIEHQITANVSKKNIVAYNPKKGKYFTQKIINHAKNIEFKAIENMTREEVALLLSQAKVYIDFGNHPGKDRIPREAAISGACVISNKCGSAKFTEDLPIEPQYKFSGNDGDIQVITLLIQDCLDNYATHSRNFATYRSLIQAEQAKFVSDVAEIFTQ